MDFINKNKGLVVMIIGLIALLIYNWDQVIPNPSETPENLSITLIEPITTESVSVDTIIIEIKGEVNHPGIYELEQGSRVGEAIKIAGGLTNYADISSLNQAQKLTDEQLLIIPTSTETVINIQVEIKGEVNDPGVYVLYKNSRVEDLIFLAGGFTAFADTTNVELAKTLIDGETISIPKVIVQEEESPSYIYVEIAGEIINPGVYLIPNTYTLEDLINEAGGVTSQCDLSKINWNLKLAQGASIYIYSYQEDIPEESTLININTASLSELDSLPGIGEILGQRIIDYRKEYGDFKTIEDIMLVEGIKFTIYEEIKELITV